MSYAESNVAIDAEARRVRVEEDLAMLRELAEAGMSRARELSALAVQAEPAMANQISAAREADVGLAYERIARAVRRILALECMVAGEAPEGLDEDLDLRDRLFHEIVAEIRADLGLAPDPSLRMRPDLDGGERNNVRGSTA